MTLTTMSRSGKTVLSTAGTGGIMTALAARRTTATAVVVLEPRAA